METTILPQPHRVTPVSYKGFVVTFSQMATAVAAGKQTRSRTSIVLATAVRIALFAICCAGLGMAVGLFTGIVVQVIRSLSSHGAIDMTVAYRYFGIPVAAACGVGALIVFSVLETRTARRLLASREAGSAH
jgi:hypothetical protein